MHHSASSFKHSLTCRIISASLVFIFSFGVVLPPDIAQAQVLPMLPLPGTMVTASPGYIPALIKGITIHPENPLQFDFIVDNGHSKLHGQALEDEALTLIKYFLASLTVPENELWVNLSPYEKDRVISERFGMTEMGMNLLAQDYILKQLTASLVYPENETGKKFWDKVRGRAQKEFGTTNVTMDNFHKVWIVPQDALVMEDGNSAYVIESRLRVMMEQDYFAMQNSKVGTLHATSVQDNNNDPSTNALTALQTEIMREIILPEIEKEVNEGQNFAQLRQIYQSLILATWFKKTLKESLLGQVYVDRNKVKGVDTDDPALKQKIYDQYVKAFEQGVYNYIKEEVDPATNQVVPRQYFSGGLGWEKMSRTQRSVRKNELSGSRRGAAARAMRPAGDDVVRMGTNLVENLGKGDQEDLQEQALARRGSTDGRGYPVALADAAMLADQVEELNKKSGKWSAAMWDKGDYQLIDLRDKRQKDTYFRTTLKKGFRVVSWVVNGVSQFRRSDDLKDLVTGDFTMAPFLNRLKDGKIVRNGRTIYITKIPALAKTLSMDGDTGNPMHGVARIAEVWKEFDIGEDSEGVSIPASFESTDFPGLSEAFGHSKTTKTFHFNGNDVTTDVVVENLTTPEEAEAQGGYEVIADVGEHPFLEFTPGETTVQIVRGTVKGVFEVDSQLIPTGKILPVEGGNKDLNLPQLLGPHIDNTFYVKPDANGEIAVVVTDKKLGRKTTFVASGMFADSEVIHIWGGQAEGKKYYGVGAVEAVTATANGPQRQGQIGGTKVLKTPGERRAGRVKMTFESIAAGATDSAMLTADEIQLKVGDLLEEVRVFGHFSLQEVRSREEAWRAQVLVVKTRINTIKQTLLSIQQQQGEKSKTSVLKVTPEKNQEISYALVMAERSLVGEIARMGEWESERGDREISDFRSALMALRRELLSMMDAAKRIGLMIKKEKDRAWDADSKSERKVRVPTKNGGTVTAMLTSVNVNDERLVAQVSVGGKVIGQLPWKFIDYDEAPLDAEVAEKVKAMLSDSAMLAEAVQKVRRLSGFDDFRIVNRQGMSISVWTNKAGSRDSNEAVAAAQEIARELKLQVQTDLSGTSIIGVRLALGEETIRQKLIPYQGSMWMRTSDTAPGGLVISLWNRAQRYTGRRGESVPQEVSQSAAQFAQQYGLKVYTDREKGKVIQVGLGMSQDEARKLLEPIKAQLDKAMLVLTPEQKEKLLDEKGPEGVLADEDLTPMQQFSILVYGMQHPMPSVSFEACKNALQTWRERNSRRITEEDRAMLAEFRSELQTVVGKPGQPKDVSLAQLHRILTPARLNALANAMSGKEVIYSGDDAIFSAIFPEDSEQLGVRVDGGMTPTDDEEQINDPLSLEHIVLVHRTSDGQDGFFTRTVYSMPKEGFAKGIQQAMGIQRRADPNKIARVVLECFTAWDIYQARAERGLNKDQAMLALTGESMELIRQRVKAQKLPARLATAIAAFYEVAESGARPDAELEDAPPAKTADELDRLAAFYLMSGKSVPEDKALAVTQGLKKALSFEEKSDTAMLGNAQKVVDLLTKASLEASRVDTNLYHFLGHEGEMNWHSLNQKVEQPLDLLLELLTKVQGGVEITTSMTAEEKSLIETKFLSEAQNYIANAVNEIRTLLERYAKKELITPLSIIQVKCEQAAAKVRAISLSLEEMTIVEGDAAMLTEQAVAFEQKFLAIDKIKGKDLQGLLAMLGAAAQTLKSFGPVPYQDKAHLKERMKYLGGSEAAAQAPLLRDTRVMPQLEALSYEVNLLREMKTAVLTADSKEMVSAKLIKDGFPKLFQPLIDHLEGKIDFDELVNRAKGSSYFQISAGVSDAVREEYARNVLNGLIGSFNGLLEFEKVAPAGVREGVGAAEDAAMLAIQGTNYSWPVEFPKMVQEKTKVLGENDILLVVQMQPIDDKLPPYIVFFNKTTKAMKAVEGKLGNPVDPYFRVYGGASSIIAEELPGNVLQIEYHGGHVGGQGETLFLFDLRTNRIIWHNTLSAVKRSTNNHLFITKFVHRHESYGYELFGYNLKTRMMFSIGWFSGGVNVSVHDDTYVVVSPVHQGKSSTIYQLTKEGADRKLSWEGGAGEWLYENGKVLIDRTNGHGVPYTEEHDLKTGEKRDVYGDSAMLAQATQAFIADFASQVPSHGTVDWDQRHGDTVADAFLMTAFYELMYKGVVSTKTIAQGEALLPKFRGRTRLHRVVGFLKEKGGRLSLGARIALVEQVQLSFPRSPRIGEIRNKLRQERDASKFGKDAAMLTAGELGNLGTGEFEKGGIDLNPALLDLKIKRDGNGIPLPMPQQSIQELMEIEGFLPVIINVTPIANLPMLLGLEGEGDSNKEETIAKLSFYRKIDVYEHKFVGREKVII